MPLEALLRLLMPPEMVDVVPLRWWIAPTLTPLAKDPTTTLPYRSRISTRGAGDNGLPSTSAEITTISSTSGLRETGGVAVLLP
jgi:hypothetical protein